MAVFEFQNDSSGSVYFTYETVRNENGFYDANSLQAAAGEFVQLDGIDSSWVIQDNYIWAVVVPEGYSFLEFNPTETIPPNSVYFRGTGNLTVTVTT